MAWTLTPRSVDSVTAVLPEPDQLAALVAAGNRPALAAALNLLDDQRPAARRVAARLLGLLPRQGSVRDSQLIGITGPPGAGKSSLTSALITVWRQRGQRVAVLAVDPSSPISGGALLGDRLRMKTGIEDDGVFIRSLACRGEHGGLSAEVWPMCLAMLASFDITVIETVGVGQSEIDIAKMSDTTCFVAQPGSGDSIQYLKAGIMEIPHVLVVNKEDMGAAARKTVADLRAASSRKHSDDEWAAPILSVSATHGTGIDKLVEVLDAHHAWLAERHLIEARRHQFQLEWVIKRLQQEFGSTGVALLRDGKPNHDHLIQPDDSAFEQYEQLREQLAARWNAA
jgi:LAO/AO transport system kinase